MTHAIRFGSLVLPNEDMQTLIRKAKNLENCGFDIFAGADHFCDWSDISRPWFEGWISLTAVALATTNLRIATYVSQIPLRHPAMLARQAQTLDHACNGRLEVGLGTGIGIDPSYDMMAIPNWDGKERVARFKEYMEIVDRLLANDKSSFEGEYYSIKDAVMRPAPVQSPRPPITIGAIGPVMCRFAARAADTWNTMSFADSFDKQLAEARGKVAIVDEACAKAGRDPATLRRSYLMYDPAARRDGGAFSYYNSVGAFEDYAGQIIEAGFSELVLYYPAVAAQEPMMERIAHDVFPKLRAAD